MVAVAGLLAILTAASCGSTASTPPAATSDTMVSEHITVDGTVRSYLVLDPTPRDTRPQALVLVLHGGKSTGSAIVGVTQFDQVAEADGFIVAFPDGAGGHWNSGSCCGATVVSAADELAFFSQMLEKISHDYDVDQSRVYVAGFSAGAFMAYRLACDLSSRITAIASVSGSMPDGPCTPQRSVSVLEIHGTADDQLPYAGGVAPGISDDSPSTVSVVTAWARRDSCDATPASGGTAAVQTMTWKGCASGAVVELDTVSGGGHSWYSLSLPGPDGSLDATDTVWRFFAPLRSH